MKTIRQKIKLSDMLTDYGKVEVLLRMLMTANAESEHGEIEVTFKYNRTTRISRALRGLSTTNGS